MSWEQLVAILRLGAAERAAADARPPVACPYCGEPLRPGPQGQLYCRNDGYQPDGTSGR